MTLFKFSKYLQCNLIIQIVFLIFAYNLLDFLYIK